MMNRPDKDTYYLDIALSVSKRSTCLKRHYGCVIVKDDVIVATGYNGSPRGEVNCCDCGVCQRADAARYSSYEQCPAVHAEQNALLSVDRAHSQGATLYLACEEFDCYGYPDGSYEFKWSEDKYPQPCNLCERMIRNAGITKIVTRGGLKGWV